MNPLEIVVANNARAAQIEQHEIDFYQANGFVRVRNILSRDEAMQFREAALDSRKAPRVAITAAFFINR